jgi:3-methylcrotonyl-CoA carboxylase alpha subunit
VVDAGIVFIGPSAAFIRAMGLKDAAKALMEKAGVPVVPGYHGDGAGAGAAGDQGPRNRLSGAYQGARWRRRQGHAQSRSPGRVRRCAGQREARGQGAFGDDAVLVEKYVEKPRHIEVQVFGDNHGNAVHLFERDCSAQRRHQKVIEEAPAPDMPDDMRKAMTDAAVKAAKAINYSGAGTIEFIVDASEGLRADRFWFMEMNTRLQVEHPVTEMVTGVDLVEWQLRVAAGEKIPLEQNRIRLNGHAFEARIYAEDATKGFLPAIGTLHHLRFPARAPAESAMRIETGVREGDAISPFYDPMIAKLVVHAADRAAALTALAEALDETEIAGSITNTAFLKALAIDTDFAAGDVDTGLIARHQDELTALPLPGVSYLAAAAAAASGASLQPSAADPWRAMTGYAHYHPIARQVMLEQGEKKATARVTAHARGLAVSFAGEEPALAHQDVRVALWPGHVTVFDGAVGHNFKVYDPFEAASDAGGGSGTLRAPMPGLVKVVRASAGDTVKKGAPLLILEAMKMEHTIAAPFDGEIAEIVTEGAQVMDGAVLVKFKEA